MTEFQDVPQELRSRSNMQDFQRLARIYAEALLNAAEKKGLVDVVRDELGSLVQEVYRAVPTLPLYLSSGGISRQAKTHLLQQAFAGRTSELFYNFLLVLNEHERLNVLDLILDAYNEIDDRRRRRIRVQVRTTMPLTEEQTQRLLRELRDEFKLEPILNTVIDPDILGGIILQVGDWVFDRSVRNELMTVRKHLLARGSHEIQSGRDRFSHSAGA